MTTTMILFCIAAFGYLLGCVKVGGLQLGSSGVLLVALLFGHFGMEIPALVRDMGLVLFVTAVGFIAGPVFFRNFKEKAVDYIILGFLITLVGTGVCVVSVKFWGLSAPLAVGLLSGALTSTPGLAAAIEASGSNLAGISYGVAYPFGVVGVVLFVQLVPKLLRVDLRAEAARFEAALSIEKNRENATQKYYSVDDYGFFSFSVAAILGLLVGRITLPLPGGASFNLGTTGGPLLTGLIMGHLAHIGPLSVTLPASTSKPMREFGLILFLMGAGTNAGKGFVEVLMEHGGVKLFFIGTLMTTLPMIAGFWVGRRFMKLDLFNMLGSICGGMTSTPALGALISVSGTDAVTTAYAATYPIALISVVLSCQFISLLM